MTDINKKRQKGILEYLTPDSNGAYWSKYIGNCAVYVAENSDERIGIPKEWQPLEQQRISER